MNSKSLLIAIAALALTATGAQAFSSSTLMSAGLTEQQQAAFEEARGLREEGDVKGARDLLVEAGIDEDTLKKVRSAMHDEKHTAHEAIKAALDADDFAAFSVAIANTPLADIITSAADFQSFKEAHALMEAGDKAGAQEIFTELGLPEKTFAHQRGQHRGAGAPAFINELTDVQKSAFAVARQANDRDAMEAILAEAGIEKPMKGETQRRLRDGRELD